MLVLRTRLSVFFCDEFFRFILGLPLPVARKLEALSYTVSHLLPKKCNCSVKSLTAVEWLRHLKATGNHQSGKIWQDRYHDHIIRNEDDLNIKRQYIQNNPIVAQLKKADQSFP